MYKVKTKTDKQYGLLKILALSIIPIHFAGLSAREMADYTAKNEVRLASSTSALVLTNSLANTLVSSTSNINASLPVISTGASLYWGYIVSPRTVFGVNMAYRYAPGYNSYAQFIAGLQSRIYFSREVELIFRPFVTYGFQAITTYLTVADDPALGQTGQHRSIHLGLGSDLFEDFYFEVLYVYSRFSSFGKFGSIAFDNAQIDFGYKWVY